MPEEKPKKDLPGDLVANLEQFNTYLEDVAECMGTYYQSLIKHGVPHELACDLVREFNENLFYKLSGRTY